MVVNKLISLLKGNGRRVKSKNPNDIIYHCTIQKSGSMWIQGIFKDRRVYKYTGFEVMPFRFLQTSIQETPIPVILDKCIAVRLYINYDTYKAIRKPSRYKTVYVLRDPRDIIVSWYFSTKYAHGSNPIVDRDRKKLNSMDMNEGFLYSIRYLSDIGFFNAQRSWLDAEKEDPHVKLFKYEDLIENEIESFRALFQHCDIQMPERVFRSLIKDHSFEKKAKRKRGDEDIYSLKRKGISGDWKNHLTAKMMEMFKEETGDLVVRMGYEKDEDWHL